MEKEQFQEPEMEIIHFDEATDIITTSGDDLHLTGNPFTTITF